MDRVWVKGRSSRKVIEEADAHYFYWKVETGLTRISFKLKGHTHTIPIFFLKSNDYEPVKRKNGEVRSRFHHRFLTIFRRPRVMIERPIATFLTLAHVPIILCDPPKRVRTEFDADDLSFEETWSLPIFLAMLKENCWKDAKTSELKDYTVASDNIPSQALFDERKLPLHIEISI